MSKKKAIAGVLFGIAAYVGFVTWTLVANHKTPMQVVDFDFQGLRLGDPAPARLKLDNPKDDLVNELIAGTKSSVWYTILDGKVEALTIDFEDPYQAIEAYEQKFGVRAKREDDDAIWLTQNGEFRLSKRTGSGRITSEKYSAHASESVKKKLDNLGSKL